MSTIPSLGKKELWQVIESLPLSVSLISQNSTVLLTNNQTSLIFGKPAHEIIGYVGGEAFGCQSALQKNGSCGSHPECALCELRNTVMQTFQHHAGFHQIPTQMEFEPRGTLYLRVSTQPVYFEQELAVLLSMEDVTSLEMQEQQTLHAEKLQATIEALGAVCHEFNQPLQAVMSILELAEMECPQDDAVTQNAIQDALAEINKLAKITQKMNQVHKYATKPYLKGSRILDLDAATN